MIYFDNASTTLKKPQSVIDAVLDTIGNVGNASRGAYESSLEASRLVYRTRLKLAKFFNCSNANNVAFTCNATESLNIAINGLIESGNHVITTQLEHNSVLRPLYRLQKEKNVEISFIPTDSSGYPIYNEIENLINKNTKAIICTHGSNLTGNVIDVAKIGEIAQKHNILFILDVAQTAGVIPIDMQKIGVDVLCFTGHKSLLGIQGIGGICVRKNINIKPFKVGGTGVQSYSKEQPKQMPVCLEAGTLNIPGISSLSAGIDYINKVGIGYIYNHEHTLMRKFYTAIKKLPNIKIYGDFSDTCNHLGVLSLNIGTMDSSVVSDLLFSQYGIATRSGIHCVPLLHDQLGTQKQGAVRFSFSWFNTTQEVDKAVKAIREICSLGDENQ